MVAKLSALACMLSHTYVCSLHTYICCMHVIYLILCLIPEVWFISGPLGLGTHTMLPRTICYASRFRINEPICEYNFAKFRDWKLLILKINDLPTYIIRAWIATRQHALFALLMKSYMALVFFARDWQHPRAHPQALSRHIMIPVRESSSNFPVALHRWFIQLLSAKHGDLQFSLILNLLSWVKTPVDGVLFEEAFDLTVLPMSSD